MDVGMVWIDYGKVYDTVIHFWINECLKMFGKRR